MELGKGGCYSKGYTNEWIEDIEVELWNM